MSASQSGTFNVQQFTDIGGPLIGGRLYTYAFGTTAHKTAFTDHAASVPHTYTSDGLGGQYIALNARGELPAPLYLAAGSYDLTLRTAAGATMWTRRADPVWDITSDLSAPTGASLVGYLQTGAGAVPWDVQGKLREFVSLSEFGVIGDGMTPDSTTIQNAINASSGKTLLGMKGETYLIRDQLVIPSDVTIDFQGATVIDDVRTFRAAGQAYRAKPLFYMYGVSGIKIKNFVYRSTGTRATVSDEVPTGIIWIGDNSTTGPGPTFDIEVSGIKASNLAASSLFVGVVGEAYNLHIHDIDITGNCSYGFNCEYGQAPTGTTDALAYGLHPHNILIERFNGYNNTTSVGFLRSASCYNVTFRECYGRDVKSFIYTWTGDRSISRVSQSVKFENCAHYASSTFLPGVVNYVVQVSCANKDGSTGVPLPAWTNYDHLFTFENCQFQNNKTTFSTGVRFYGSQGSTVFNSCIFQGSDRGIWGAPASNPDYTSVFSLTFNDCVFKKNSRHVLLEAIRGVMFNHCKFLEPDENAIPVKIDISSFYNKFHNCQFAGVDIDLSYVVINAGCEYNEITNCIFLDGGTTPPLDLSAVTLGSGNLTGPKDLCVGGWSHFGVLGEPTSLFFSVIDLPDTFLDAYKRRQFAAETGGVNKILSRIINGRIGDEITVQATSTIATVQFNHQEPGVPTSEWILTPAGANLIKTGSYWIVTLKSTPVGWVLSE